MRGSHLELGIKDRVEETSSLRNTPVGVKENGL